LEPEEPPKASDSLEVDPTEYWKNSSDIGRNPRV
jgi:hypothetical protein